MFGAPTPVDGRTDSYSDARETETPFSSAAREEPVPGTEKNPSPTLRLSNGEHRRKHALSTAEGHAPSRAEGHAPSMAGGTIDAAMRQAIWMLTEGAR
jgi:hypothetical protein